MARSNRTIKAVCPTTRSSIAGVPLTITTLADLTLAEGENAIVDIDLSYFPALKLANQSYRAGTKSVLEFVRELGKRNVRAKIVTVNLSNQNNQVPMDLRFYGDVIREALAKPDVATPPYTAKWLGMMQAEDSLGAQRYASATALYEDALRTAKDDAGLYFSLAVARGLENKGPECRAALLEAYRLDSAYLKGFFQLAGSLASPDPVLVTLGALNVDILNSNTSSPEAISAMVGVVAASTGASKTTDPDAAEGTVTIVAPDVSGSTVRTTSPDPASVTVGVADSPAIAGVFVAPEPAPVGVNPVTPLISNQNATAPEAIGVTVGVHAQAYASAQIAAPEGVQVTTAPSVTFTTVDRTVTVFPLQVEPINRHAVGENAMNAVGIAEWQRHDRGRGGAR